MATAGWHGARGTAPSRKKRGVEMIQALEGRILDELEGLSKADAGLAGLAIASIRI